MTTKERMRRAITGEGLPDRVPLTEISIWPETAERWRQEGMPADADPIQWLGMDPIAIAGCDTSLRLGEETICEDEQTITVRNTDGVQERRWKAKTATPDRLEPLIRTPDDWLKVRERLEFTPERIPANYAEMWKQSQEAGTWFCISPGEPIWWVLMAMGYDVALPFLMDYPEAVEDMVATQARLSLAIINAVMELGKPDALWYFSDLCYKNGMLFSPQYYRAIVLPHVKRVTQACHDRGIATMYHCCGDQRPFLPLMIEAGFDCAQPMEARTGCDVREMKALYGLQVTFMGNIGVERLSGTVEEAEEEVRSKVSVAAVGGRYVFHSDHSLPPTIPLAVYRRALEVVREVGTYE